MIVDHGGHPHLAYVLELPSKPGEAQLDTTEWFEHEGVELVVIGAAAAAGRELGIELDPEAESVHDADPFETLRLNPEDLPVEPIRSGRLR